MDAGNVVAAVRELLRSRLEIDDLRLQPSLVAALELHQSCTVLLEHEYFDTDGRSEMAAIYARRYETIADVRLRLHFFSELLDKQQFIALTPSGGSDSYLGYLIPRPTTNNRDLRVGRTLLRPPSRLTHRDRDGALFDEWDEGMDLRVRTVVAEAVEIAGVRLWAQGVPFMQQDGSVLSCAHVVTWMTLYSMALQGYCVRVPVTDVATAGSAPERGREYPTTGWLDEQMVSALATFGLNPLLQLLEGLDAHVVQRWHTRPDVVDEDRRERAGFSEFVARYLNSGLPVILGVGSHAVVACGYLRNRDRSDPTAWEEARPSTVHSFIVHDDQAGPYRTVTVAELVGDEGNQLSAIVPCVPGMDLGGADAEARASDVAEHQIQEAYARVQEVDQAHTRELVTLGHEALTAASHDEGIALRSYCSLATDFKTHIRSQPLPDPVRQHLLSRRMPRFVWVVELIDRQLRHQVEPAVRGLVVLDASSGYQETEPVFLWTPGHARGLDLPSGETVELRMDDVRISSGRHGHRGHTARDDGWSTAQRLKNVPSTRGGVL